MRPNDSRNHFFRNHPRRKMSENSSAGYFDGQTSVTSLVRSHGAMTRVSLVEFKDGARTWWHSHEGEQVLVVTEGNGVLVTDDGITSLQPGVIARIPAGQLHWHGAVEGAEMVHVAATIGASIYDRPVDAEDARAAISEAERAERS
jgi:quercetin dioxygenase-like cupin family protein